MPFCGPRKRRGLRRELYAGLEDVFILPRTPRGEQVDAILSRLIEPLRASGRLAALYRRIHAPFDPWQPPA
jgi:polar amino acid transport system substrate-binding protein